MRLSRTRALLASCVLGAAAGVLPAQAPGAINFASTTLATPSGAYYVATGDFNEDGDLDLVTANHAASNVSIFLGSGNGTFGAAANFATGAGPTSVTVGDWDEDGHLDLATSNDGADNITTLRGSGFGTFGAPAAFSLGGSLNPENHIVDIDLDRDGDQDLAANVIAPHGSGGSVLLGNGNGGFSFLVAGNLVGHGLAFGRFNADLFPDVAQALVLSSDFSVGMGVGDGYFSGGATYTSGSGARWPLVFDWNGNGIDDLAVANAGNGVDGNTVRVMNNTGVGAFTSVGTFGVGTNPVHLASGDFDGNNVTDLVAANSSSSDISILPGTGTPSVFLAAVNFGAGVNPNASAVGDFNEDGVDDIAVGNLSGNVTFLRNAPTAARSPANMSFGTVLNPVPQGTASASQQVTYTNNGSAPLSISGFSFSGSHPFDFTVGQTTCLAPIAPGGTCQAHIRFVPGAQGNRTATLNTFSNASPTAQTLALVGEGGVLPTGQQGPPGPAGPQGPPGRDATVTCKPKGKRVKCRVIFAAASKVRHAALSRDGVTYARGVPKRRGGRLVLRFVPGHRLEPGTYTLAVVQKLDGRRVVTKSRVRVR